LPGVLEYFRTLREKRGDLTLAELRELHRRLARGADALYRLADRVERDTRVRVPRRPLDDLADQVARIAPADDPVTEPIRVAIAELRKRLRDLAASALSTNPARLNAPVRGQSFSGPRRSAPR
jgi:hypothetical protein